MSKANVIAALLTLSSSISASDENPDMNFLEWLGQVTEVEELGVDVDSLMESQEADSEDSDEEQSE